MGLFDFIFRKKKEQDSNNNTNLLEKIEIAPGLSIPRAFLPYSESILKTKLSYISIQATPGDDLTLEQSKFGHYPFMPAGFEYPKDADGKFMYPLAQLNFAEMPALENFPEKGYLQFYISLSNYMWGLDFENPQSQMNFRALFFEEEDIKNYKIDFSFLDDVITDDTSPVFKPHRLSFTIAEQYLGAWDVDNEALENNLIKIANQNPEIKKELLNNFFDAFSCNGHKAGGYAYFTQTDPRKYKTQFRDYILLFQLDSDEEIMWGDMGIANFFIHPDDLRKKDFSKVMYNWDCG